MSIQQDLSIRGESIQRVYDLYTSQRFFVDRRYQRKLVWTIEEKQGFIDSIHHGFPIPLILVAEVIFREETRFEIIDGMQRLNAIVSFIEGEFTLEGGYFDLNTLASTKLLLDKKVLEQQTPILDREICSRIANYAIPLSIYKPEQKNNIDEVFRRINSSGRQLSRQELRHAGMKGLFPELVRCVSCRVRGDASHSDRLFLNQMKEISITNKKLSYGINIADIFWRKESIITLNNIRQSRDEELVAHLLAYMALGDAPPPPCSSRFLDFLYGSEFEDSESDGDEENGYFKQFEIESAVKQRTPETLEAQFLLTHQELRKVAESSPTPFGRAMFRGRNELVSQHYQAVFLALYSVLINEDLQIADYTDLSKSLKGIADRLTISRKAAWNAVARKQAIDTIKPIIRRSCAKRAVAENPARSAWSTELENLLMGSKTEQALYDFKLGFHRLDASGKFDEELLTKIGITLTGIANSGRSNVGYLIVGIADKPEDAEKHNQRYGGTVVRYNGFSICGVDAEAALHHKSLDDYFRTIVQKFAKLPISPNSAKSQVLRDVRLRTYREKSIIVFTVRAESEPCRFGDKFYERLGTSIREIPMEEHVSLYRRFLIGP